jgi:hypothetical protein
MTTIKGGGLLMLRMHENRSTTDRVRASNRSEQGITEEITTQPRAALRLVDGKTGQKYHRHRPLRRKARCQAGWLLWRVNT